MVLLQMQCTASPLISCYTRQQLALRLQLLLLLQLALMCSMRCC
jgi:hypothetical protein